MLNSRTLLGTLILLSIAPIQRHAFAGDAADWGEQPPAPAPEKKPKSWYIAFGVGYAHANYYANPTYQAVASFLPGLNEIGVTADLDVYWPIGKHVLIGVADSSFVDTYAASSSVAGMVLVSHEMLSIQIYPFSEVASGLFIRVDGGLATAAAIGGPTLYSKSTDLGGALHGGVGLAIPLGGLRIPVMAGYYYDPMSTGIITAWQIAASFQW